MISNNIFVLPGTNIEGPMTGILFASIIFYNCIHYHLVVALLNGGTLYQSIKWEKDIYEEPVPFFPPKKNSFDVWM